MLDDIAQAVLAREEVVKYLRDGGESATRPASGSTGISMSCGPRSDIRSTARCSTRSTRSCARSSASTSTCSMSSAATGSHRIVYASNHKSHTDYLVEPLVLDDNGIRPPLIAAGINLFGGPLGLLHRHVTGAIPIRRNTKDPAYLVTLKAYVAEMLKKHDLFFYPEGGRSYSGELKPSKTGLIHAALDRRARRSGDHADRHRLRPGARGPHPRAAAGEEAAAAVHARTGGNGALRGRLPLAGVRHVRRADRRSAIVDAAIARATCWS